MFGEIHHWFFSEKFTQHTKYALWTRLMTLLLGDVVRVSITVLLGTEIFVPPLFKIINIIFLITGFCRYVSENCVLLGYYASNGGNFLPTFRDNLPAPSLGVTSPKRSFITQRVMVISYLRFGQPVGSIFGGQEFKTVLY